MEQPTLHNEYVYRQPQKLYKLGYGVKWFECLLIIVTSFRVIVLNCSSIVQWVLPYFHSAREFVYDKIILIKLKTTYAHHCALNSPFLFSFSKYTATLGT